MQEIEPSQTHRAEAFALWMKAPMPMVTLFKTLNVTNLVRQSRRRSRKFNLLLCWCIGRAAFQREEFWFLPAGEKIVRYERLAVSVVVALRDGGVSTCDVPFSQDLEEFSRDYESLTSQVRDTGRPHDLSGDCMVIGTSAIPQADLDGAVNIYAGFYNNPFLIWSRYRKKFLRIELPLSFQFHHTQMDGVPAADFLECLQREIRTLSC